MSYDNGVALVLSILVTAYLVYTLDCAGEALMTAAGWLQFAFVIALLAISTPLLGRYMAKVYGDRSRTNGARARRPGVPARRALRSTACAVSIRTASSAGRPTRCRCSAFSLASLIVLYVQLRVQGHLPLNPDDLGFVRPDLAFNTAVSFLTNTNWQNYSGESTMTHLTQMAGLAFHNFVSAAAGAAVAVALIRGLVRRRTHTLGNFWVDLVRTCTRVLLPFAFVVALVLVSQGVIQNFHADRDGHDGRRGKSRRFRAAPIASQEAIKEVGENGGGPFNANSSHPFENPNGDHQHARDLGAARHPVRPHLHVREAGEGPEAGLGRASPRCSSCGSA